MVQAFSVANELQNHTLAASIMRNHNTPVAVLDDGELSILERFSTRCSTETRDALLKEYKVEQGDGRSWSGSLALMLVARYGTEREALLDSEWEALKIWFEHDAQA